MTARSACWACFSALTLRLFEEAREVKQAHDKERAEPAREPDDETHSRAEQACS